MTAFLEFLKSLPHGDGLPAEDVLVSFLPLMQQVILTHDYGDVAPLHGHSQLSVQDQRISYAEADQRPERRNLNAVEQRLRKPRTAVQVVSESRLTIDTQNGIQDVRSLALADAGDPDIRPAYYPGYVCWEHLIGHHDPITDVFSLGLILASLACALDFTSPDDCERFVTSRRNLFRLHPGLHPVIARCIVVMTDLDRHRRPPDLRALMITLENYRDQEVDFDTDLASTSQIADAAGHSRRRAVLSKLRERLFEINRRNRLLHFRVTMQTVNLTQASIPLSLNVAGIRRDQVLTWGGAFRRAILTHKPVVLNRYLNFREAVYLPGILDRLRIEARRDENDYGFAQLKLVVAFLRWSDLKAQPAERYESPLLLLPVRLDVRKGIHDRYTVQVTDDEAEVNPVVRHLFRQLYAIDLPERVPLSDEGLDHFCQVLRSSIRSGDSSVDLQMVDQPRVEVLHEKARRRLDQYRRRVRLTGRGLRQFRDIDYSYDPTSYHPLGIQIFEQFIVPAELHLESVISSSAVAVPSPQAETGSQTSPGSATQHSEPEAVEAEGHFYRLLDDVDENPLNWELDFCSVTIANLKYRRMSLARDYNRLIAEDTQNQAFESAFAVEAPDEQSVSEKTEQPGPVAEIEEPNEVSGAAAENRTADSQTVTAALSDRFHIVPCDPTQYAAIVKARSGRSFIIQGPPGTGKSQTIANLVADFVIRGKRLLFVCEKRAAVDVVYHRLRQQGLHDLCCLIHDSQADKKQFVMDLKRTYDSFLAEADQPASTRLKLRHDIVGQVSAVLRPLASFHQSMTTVPDDAGMTVRSLLDRLFLLRTSIPALTPVQRERLPPLVEIDHHRETLRSFEKRLQRSFPDGVLARHPLRLLSSSVVAAEHPLQLVSECLSRGQELLTFIMNVLRPLHLPSETICTIAQIRATVASAQELSFLAQRDLLELLDPRSKPARTLARRLGRLEKCDEKVAQTREANRFWRRKLSSGDTRTALELARRLHGKLTAFLRPDWWRLRRTLESAYDFSQHEIRPSWIHVLEQLDREHDALADRYDEACRISDEFGIDLDLDRFVADLQQLRSNIKSRSAPIQTFLKFVSTDSKGPAALHEVTAVQQLLSDFCSTVHRVLEAYEFCTPDELLTAFQQLQSAADTLPEYLHCLHVLDSLPVSLTGALRCLPLSIREMEAAAADRVLQEMYREDPELNLFDDASRSELIGKLVSTTELWMSANAAAVREAVRQRFCENVVLSETPAAQLTEDQKELKKRYRRGRRELEHEFGKSMRYKSIRELADGDTGAVIRDLKPIWLMSPLSVSDTLPLSAEHFDAVIFDEASQITLEDAVPALFRADQAIVVGDEMQLPPTSFFASRPMDDADLEFEEDGETVHYDLNSSSLLNHSSRNLPSRMLGWHYRSRSESLISFSNHAFYGGRLLTVPEETLPQAERPELRVSGVDQGADYAPVILERPVSFHFIEDGIYEDRRNQQEAEYIARLVRQLLQRKVHHSIGIVAFSEAQQSEIERALKNLADRDPDFAEVLEAELEREDDGQFAGLLVRNLENIQGDERDIIIMSVCYGPDPQGRTRMNFGPINMAGGEKRLNVAFSRAKQFMALVASLRSSAITNEYNDGANCLKKYLSYAEACSAGQMRAVDAVLKSLGGVSDAAPGAESEDLLTGQIAAELRRGGWIVDHSVGHSHFRIDLAVRQEGDDAYRLGILTDSAQWYAQQDLLEREFLKPRLLTAFGWNLMVLLAKDWYHDREGCLSRIEAALRQQDYESEV